MYIEDGSLSLLDVVDWVGSRWGTIVGFCVFAPFLSFVYFVYDVYTSFLSIKVLFIYHFFLMGKVKCINKHLTKNGSAPLAQRKYIECNKAAKTNSLVLPRLLKKPEELKLGFKTKLAQECKVFTKHFFTNSTDLSAPSGHLLLHSLYIDPLQTKRDYPPEPLLVSL